MSIINDMITPGNHADVKNKVSATAWQLPVVGAL